jgi:hypothetical protein
MSVVIEDFTEALRVLFGRHHAVCVIDGCHSTMEALVEAVEAAVDLNPEQRLVVEHGSGDAGGPSPLFVVAATGLGKTGMLAHWVAARILRGADPKRIMLATFSRLAAAEINRRVERIVAERLPPEAAAAAIPAWSGTFRALGAQLLREYAVRIGLDPRFNIHDREDSAAGMPLRKPRRPRSPSLTTRLQQIWKAARAANVEVAVTVEGDKLTATPVHGNALGEPERDDPFANPWDQVYATDQKRPP